jgi:hypothetical protein
MRGAAGDESAPAALEAGVGDRMRDASVQRADTLAKPRAELVEGGVGVDFVLDERPVQHVSVHEPHGPPGEPFRPAQEGKAGFDGAEGVGGVGVGAAEAQQPQLGAAVGILNREARRADETNPEVAHRGLPLVIVGIQGPDGAIAEQPQIPPGRSCIDAPLFGHEIGEWCERSRRRSSQLDVRDASVLQQLVGDTPSCRRGPVAAPVLMLECEASRAQLFGAAKERHSDLRELIPFLGPRHRARVRGGTGMVAEARFLDARRLTACAEGKRECRAR